MYRYLFCMCVGFFLLGYDPFEYHPYDTRLDKKCKNINAKSLEELTAKDRHSDTVRFVFMGDSQRWCDETEDFVKHVNRRNDMDFVVHGRDISDFGMK